MTPITTFVIEIVRGYRPVAFELTGAALTIGALVLNNVATRRKALRRPVELGKRPALAKAA